VKGPYPLLPRFAPNMSDPISVIYRELQSLGMPTAAAQFDVNHAAPFRCRLKIVLANGNATLDFPAPDVYSKTKMDAKRECARSALDAGILRQLQDLASTRSLSSFSCIGSPSSNPIVELEQMAAQVCKGAHPLVFQHAQQEASPRECDFTAFFGRLILC
jgi:hypothetical protein